MLRFAALVLSVAATGCDGDTEGGAGGAGGAESAPSCDAPYACTRACIDYPCTDDPESCVPTCAEITDVASAHCFLTALRANVEARLQILDSPDCFGYCGSSVEIYLHGDGTASYISASFEDFSYQTSGPRRAALRTADQYDACLASTSSFTLLECLRNWHGASTGLAPVCMPEVH